ncbi:MAG: stage V sporulation protein AE [Christensenellales bacterium]|jgi:stage V sporulation protein AE
MLLKAFIVGGLICVVGQILIEMTSLTPARILVIFVCAGVVLGAFGLYQPLIDFAGAGASVPLLGFGNSLVTGAYEAVDESGILGALYGGIKKTAAGIAAAVVFGYLAALLFNPKLKK